MASPSPAPLAQSFHVLDTLPDDLHRWLDDLVTAHHLDIDTGLVLGVALQEWVANLVQHARWANPPYIVIRIERTGETVRCSVDDSSLGFDLEAALDQRRASFSALPERGMGLMMLSAIGENLTYAPLDASHHRLRFDLAGPDAPGVDMTGPELG